jgi:hypothetical protein
MQFRSLVFAIAMLAFSAAPASSVRIVGYGLSSCGAWTDARRTQSANNLIHASWALGYISGVNEAVNAFEKKDILVRHDAQAILAWMDAYCGSNPLDKIKGALDALVGELLKRANVK